MALTFTAIDDDPIIVQEGTFAFSYKAGEDVKAGQAVAASGTMEVQVSDGDDGFVGVAGYTQSSGDMVIVYGPGNIVRAKASGSISAGARLESATNGYFMETGGADQKYHAVALESGSHDGKFRVLLV